MNPRVRDGKRTKDVTEEGTQWQKQEWVHVIRPVRQPVHVSRADSSQETLRPISEVLSSLLLCLPARGQGPRHFTSYDSPRPASQRPACQGYLFSWLQSRSNVLRKQ